MSKNEIETIDGYWHIPQNYRKVEWNEYEKVIETFYEKIEDYLAKNKKTVDVVVPILRGGMVPANYLVYRLKLLRVIPIQYKYLDDENGDYLKQILPFNPYDLEENATILLVDNHHGTGLQAETAAEEIKKVLPNATIIYASAYMDVSNQNNKNACEIIFGELTNSTVSLTPKECEEKGVEFKVPYFPWESIEEEAYINKDTTFEYSDEKKLVKSCKTVHKF